MVITKEHNSEPTGAILMLASASRASHQECLPSRSILVAARCLRISSLFFAVAALAVAVMALSMGVPTRLGNARLFILCDVFLLMPFIAVWLIAWGLDKRYMWAWFGALLVFAAYIMAGLTVLLGTAWLLPLFPFGVVGLAFLFRRDCRKEFGI